MMTGDFAASEKPISGISPKASRKVEDRPVSSRLRRSCRVGVIQKVKPIGPDGRESKQKAAPGRSCQSVKRRVANDGAAEGVGDDQSRVRRQALGGHCCVHREK
jgi:hypothetical protein